MSVNQCYFTETALTVEVCPLHKGSCLYQGKHRNCVYSADLTEEAYFALTGKNKPTEQDTESFKAKLREALRKS